MLEGGPKPEWRMVKTCAFLVAYKFGMDSPDGRK
jgi:hypothetical protein